MPRCSQFTNDKCRRKVKGVRHLVEPVPFLLLKSSYRIDGTVLSPASVFLARALDRVEPVEKPDCKRDSGPEDRLAQSDLPCRVFARRGVTGVIFFARIVSHGVLHLYESN